jgi:hypothetical protein
VRRMTAPWAREGSRFTLLYPSYEFEPSLKPLQSWTSSF